MRCKIFAVILAALISITAFAHPGRTDSQGGHASRSTGKYHFHHGYPEHQHTGGVCPYDNDDKTSSGTTTSKRKLSQESRDKINAYHEEMAALVEGTPTEKKKTVGETIGLICVISLIGIALFELITSLFKRK